MTARPFRRGGGTGPDPLLQLCEGDSDALVQMELGFADAAVVSDRNLRDRDALQRALGEQVRLEFESGRGQAERLEPIGNESPHAAADVGDRCGEQEGRQPTQHPVADAIRHRHGTVVDGASEAGSEDDRRPGTELPDDVRDDLRRIGAVAIQEDDVLIANLRDEFPKRGSLSVSTLDEDLGPEPLRDRTGLVRGTAIEQVDAVRVTSLLERQPRNPVEHVGDSVLLVEGRQQNREALEDRVRDLSIWDLGSWINRQRREREWADGRTAGSSRSDSSS